MKDLGADSVIDYRQTPLSEIRGRSIWSIAETANC